MNSWHSARTGRMPQPSHMQQIAIQNQQMKIKQEQLQQQLQQQQLQWQSPSSSPSHSLASTVALSGGGVGVGVDGIGVGSDVDWSQVPLSLTSALRSLVSSDSELRANVHRLKCACEELRREQQQMSSLAAVQQLTAGTAAMHKEMANIRSAQHADKEQYEARVHDLEATVARLTEEMAAVSRAQAHHFTATATSLESLAASQSTVHRDVQERGLIMAKLGDRLMEEMEAQRISNAEAAGRLLEVERRVHAFEYTTAVTNRVAQAAAPAFGSPAIAAAAAAHAGSAKPAPNNPLSSAASIAARKQQHFVTRDSVQSRPPGTAVFLAAGAAAAEINAHPLASVIEQHRAEKAAANFANSQARLAVGMETAAGGAVAATAAAHMETRAADSSATAIAVEPAAASPEPAEGAWDTSDSGSNHVSFQSPLFLQISSNPASAIPSPRAHTPRGLVAQAQAPTPAPAPAPLPQSLTPLLQSNTASPRLQPLTAVAPAPPPGAGGNDQGSLQFQRYMSDYTTRNLQRDLLEIAETYQSTIRNEVDGLRGQLLQLRRQHADEVAKHSAAIAAAASQSAAQQAEQSRLLSVFELFLKTRVGEVMERMARVEKRTAAVDAHSTTRAAQAELRYSQRNDEIRALLQSMHARMDEHFGGKLPATADSQRAGLEKDMRTLQLNLEQALKIQHDRNSALTHELAQLRREGDASTRALQAQVVGVHAQMKSLFADAFAALDGAGASGGGGSVAHALLPLLTPAHPGAHGSTGPAGEKGNFVMQPRSMVRTPRSRQSQRASKQGGGARAGSSGRGDAGSGLEEEAHGGGGGSGSGGVQRDSVRIRGALALSLDDAADGEEKQAVAAGRTGYGTAGQVRLRPTAVSGLTRGHGSSAASTPGAEIRSFFPEAPAAPSPRGAGSTTRVGSRPLTQQTGRAASAAGEAPPAVERERPAAIEHALATGRKDIAARPPSTQQQRAVHDANAQQDAAARPKTSDSYGKNASHTAAAQLSSTQPLSSARN